MKTRYILEQDMGPTGDEQWEPYRSPEDRVHVTSGDGVRVFKEAAKAYRYMRAVRKRTPRGRRFRVHKIELA